MGGEKKPKETTVCDFEVLIVFLRRCSFESLVIFFFHFCCLFKQWMKFIILCRFWENHYTEEMYCIFTNLNIYFGNLHIGTRDKYTISDQSEDYVYYWLLIVAIVWKDL